MATYFRLLSDGHRLSLESFLRTGKEEVNYGFQRGKEAEERFLNLCKSAHEERKFPSWVEGFKRGNQEQDAKGIDVLALTISPRVPFIPIQIKSSVVGREQFIAKNKIIPCVVVAPHISDEKNLEFTLSEIIYMWEVLYDTLIVS